MAEYSLSAPELKGRQDALAFISDAEIRRRAMPGPVNRLFPPKSPFDYRTIEGVQYRTGWNEVMKKFLDPAAPRKYYRSDGSSLIK